jgi:hypothetical protein
LCRFTLPKLKAVPPIGSTATPTGRIAPVMKLWLGPVPSMFARPIEFVGLRFVQ